MKLKLPKGIHLNDLKMTLTQDEDSCGRTGIEDQVLEVEFQDAGGGFYYVLKTDRWAIDQDDLSLFKALGEMCEELDKVSIFKEDENK